MNYEQLEIYFGSPGRTIVVPSFSEACDPASYELSVMKEVVPEGAVQNQWREIFDACRVLNKKIAPPYIFFRTGILYPSSKEGTEFRGKVLLARMDCGKKPLGPTQIDLFHLRLMAGLPSFLQLAAHWSELPKRLPLPENNPKVPYDLRSAWFSGCDAVPLHAQSVRLTACAWEELL